MNHAVEAIRLFKLLDRNQRNTFFACFLGWALDAFDFFLLTFVIVPMAGDFGTSIAELSFAITLTLATRPVGAFIFGLLGDRFGRRMPLMIDIIFYSLMELLTAFSPNFTTLLIFRALYGIGIAGLVAPAACDGGFLERRVDCYKTPLGAFSLRYFANDSVQRDVAWDAGHVSNFSRRTTSLRRHTKGGDRDHLRFRRHLRWNGRRSSLAKMGTPSFDYFDCCGWNPPDSGVGFFTQFHASCDRRIRHAIHGAGRLGNRASASE